jgi:deoxyribonuclease V
MPPVKIRRLHNWCLSPSRAQALQKKLAAMVRLERMPQEIELVAGADAAFCQGQVLAAVVMVKLPDLSVVEENWARVPLRFPYLPGLLSFREGPALIAAFRRLKARPQAVIFDGQGIAHPRGLGLAAHLGLWLGIPSIGCAKSLLCGEFSPPGPRRGERSALVYQGRQVGVVLRTRDGVKPVFVSPGHLADIESAARLVLTCTKRYRLPEPTRLADILADRLKR